MPARDARRMEASCPFIRPGPSDEYAGGGSGGVARGSGNRCGGPAPTDPSPRRGVRFAELATSDPGIAGRTISRVPRPNVTLPRRLRDGSLTPGPHLSEEQPPVPEDPTRQLLTLGQANLLDLADPAPVTADEPTAVSTPPPRGDTSAATRAALSALIANPRPWRTHLPRPLAPFGRVSLAL